MYMKPTGIYNKRCIVGARVACPINIFNFSGKHLALRGEILPPPEMCRGRSEKIDSDLTDQTA